MTLALQFGHPRPDRDYQPRPAAFGLAFQDGHLACVRVTRDTPYLDLPGGAIDGSETEVEALIREFVEETGLLVRPLDRLGEAAQVFERSDGVPVNNLGGFWTVEVLSSDPGRKVENDHELVWMDPHEALAHLRHEAHAWAVALWLRRQARPYGTPAPIVR